MITNNSKLVLSWVLLLILALGVSTDASAQRKKKKKKKKKEKTEMVNPDQPDSRIIDTEKSTVCEVFTVENPDLVKISQNFAFMNLRRQVKDYGPGEYTALDYWTKMYEQAPGFSILVYTDGSAIFRELAAKAKDEENEEQFEEYSQRALDLLDEGEKCFPNTKGKFGPPKAYIKELLTPNKYEEIFSLYTEGFNDETDPYSLISITRYAQYMGYIDKIPVAEANEWLEKCRAVAVAHKGNPDYDYAAETVEAIENQYKEIWAQKEAYDQQTAQNNEQKQQAAEGNSLYNEMTTAIESGNLSAGFAKYKEYIKTVTDSSRKYQVAMYMGGSLYNTGDYVNARTAYNDAINADSSKGDPYYFIGNMYLSSGEKCGPGVGFESQQILWPAFQQFKIAQSKSLDPDYASGITSTIAQYKQYLPTNAQLAEKGLKLGDTYTVPCWINETITVTSKESPGL